MQLDQILVKGKCCITGKPLADCKNINTVQLNFPATWEYPVWGNFFSGQRHMAIAYVHDDCIDKDGAVIGKPKFAVEFTEDDIIYHDIPENQVCRKCGCTEDNCHGCIDRTGKPCHWVEVDLCSACKVFSIYAIYAPTAERKGYTIGKFDMIQGQTKQDLKYHFNNPDLETCRKEMRRHGFIKQTKHEEDHEEIIESWV